MKGPEILLSLLYLTHKISYLHSATGRVFSNIYLDIDCHTYAPVRRTLVRLIHAFGLRPPT